MGPWLLFPYVANDQSTKDWLYLRTFPGEMGRGEEWHHSRAGDESNWKRNSSKCSRALPGLVVSGISRKILEFVLVPPATPADALPTEIQLPSLLFSSFQQ